MADRLPLKLTAHLRNLIDSRTEGLSPKIAGLLYAIVNRHGEIVFQHVSGSTGLGVDQPLSYDTTFWIASFTKMITGISCMQLVEQNILFLDDADQVEALAPELRDVKVIQRNAEGQLMLVPKVGRITLRMLLNHTAGFGYAFEDINLRDWARPVGIKDFTTWKHDVLSRPLSHQPGTAFQYGTNVDWAAVLVERVSGMSLQEYFDEKIFGPVGIDGITFTPSSDMISNLAYMHRRNPDGTLSLTDHLFRDPLLPQTTIQERESFCSGGAGCFGKPIQYLKLIAVLLNDGVYAQNGVRLLRPETIKEMFSDQIINNPRFCNESVPVADPSLANPTPIFPAPDYLTEGWGLTFSLSHVALSTGRAAGAGSWEGLANLFWFADRTNGLGGVIATQILPYGDKEVLQLSEELETKIYDALVDKA